MNALYMYVLSGLPYQDCTTVSIMSFPHEVQNRYLLFLVYKRITVTYKYRKFFEMVI